MLAPFLLSLLTQIPGQRSPIDPGLNAAQPSPHFRALLVGCSAYGKSIGSVNGDRDAKRLAIALKRTLGVGDAQIHVLVGPAATKARVLHEIDDWLVRGAARGDSVFFGFSGLGTQVLDASGKVIEPALLPIDARRIKPRAGDAEADSDIDPGSVILAKDLRLRLDKLARVGASVVTLAFDCGAVYDGDSAIRGLRKLKAAHNPAIDRAITGGLKPSITTLADELAGPNLAAISAGPYAYECVDGGNLSLAMMLAMNRLAARVAYAPGSLQTLPTFGEGLDMIDAEMPALPQQMPQTPGFGGDRRLPWLGLPLKAPDLTPGVALRKGTGNEPSIWMQEGFVSGVRVGASVSLYLWPNAPRLPGLPGSIWRGTSQARIPQRSLMGAWYESRTMSRKSSSTPLTIGVFSSLASSRLRPHRLHLLAKCRFGPTCML